MLLVVVGEGGKEVVKRGSPDTISTVSFLSSPPSIHVKFIFNNLMGQVTSTKLTVVIASRYYYIGVPKYKFLGDSQKEKLLVEVYTVESLKSKPLG